MTQAKPLTDRILGFLRSLPIDERWQNSAQIAMCLNVTQAAIERALDDLAGVVEVAVRGRWGVPHVAFPPDEAEAVLRWYARHASLERRQRAVSERLGIPLPRVAA